MQAFPYISQTRIFLICSLISHHLRLSVMLSAAVAHHRSNTNDGHHRSNTNDGHHRTVTDQVTLSLFYLPIPFFFAPPPSPPYPPPPTEPKLSTVSSFLCFSTLDACVEDVKKFKSGAVVGRVYQGVSSATSDHGSQYEGYGNVHNMQNNGQKMYQIYH
ncbi:hypothetical protein L1987_20333 [Smallanthus sonchifolius]|uniref:Uncharacterized protein n=1 Tax=Smallanthus sonchifolius TaxID=185202 RepID=A0ACB9ISB8_9ASTR|nr:hypothetical protein L1987_20333 [Smallanthus sonchifolius]